MGVNNITFLPNLNCFKFEELLWLVIFASSGHPIILILKVCWHVLRCTVHEQKFFFSVELAGNEYFFNPSREVSNMGMIRFYLFFWELYLH